ncbi:hypothetical protein ACFCZT_09210 [Streptomyces sp. NPDC056230]|uniref:hypothetical protein n=1 Tax=unclassified Streptomyces TaxID=2593676 RepID=UPI0035DD3931
MIVSLLYGAARARPAVTASLRPFASDEGAELTVGKRKTNPAGSTNSFRGDVVRVIGVLKVATADQIQRIGAPHLSYRHTDKKTQSEQKTARTASHNRRALRHAQARPRRERRFHGGGERLRNLTAKGLEGASYLGGPGGDRLGLLRDPRRRRCRLSSG